MKKFSLFFVLAIMIACTPNPPEEGNKDKEPTIKVTPEVIESPAEGGGFILHVSCESYWQASSKSSWVSINPTSGIGDDDVRVTVQSHTSPNSDTAFIYFAKDEIVKVAVCRKGYSNGISVSPSYINAPVTGGEYTLEVITNTQWAVNSNASWVTYNPGVGKKSGKITVKVAPASVESSQAILTISEYGTGNKDNKVEVNISRKGFNESGFSVNEFTKVAFAPGNLQYQASTDTWRFAENQYDYIGRDNEKISDTYDGWIDAFGWGTGDRPTFASTQISDYGTFVDWGVNPISNGGQMPNMWRTLSKDEMEYIWSKRENADKLCGLATVRGVHGFVFLPDNSLPHWWNFTPTIEDWSTNNISSTDWKKMEKYGAVFLPATGRRYGTTVTDIGVYGSYWTSSSGTMGSMFYFGFDGDKKKPYIGGAQFPSGFPVRLVMNIMNLEE